MPVTIPDVPIVAIDVLLLLQDPPVEVVASVFVWPTQRPMVPVIVAGATFMVIGLVTVQPVPREWVIVTVPEITPLTMADVEPMPAIDVLLLVHTPPVMASASGVVAPAQTVDAPVMAVGDALTDMVRVV
jgi:hypothetical protein